MDEGKACDAAEGLVAIQIPPVSGETWFRDGTCRHHLSIPPSSRILVHVFPRSLQWAGHRLLEATLAREALSPLRLSFLFGAAAAADLASSRTSPSESNSLQSQVRPSNLRCSLLPFGLLLSWPFPFPLPDGPGEKSGQLLLAAASALALRFCHLGPFLWWLLGRCHKAGKVTGRNCR